MPTTAVKPLTESELLKQIEILKWKHGGPRAVWEWKAPLVEKLIRDSKMRSFTAEWSAKMPKVLPTWDGFCGGIRLPHFHLHDEVYPVTPEVWHTFTNEILKEATTRIEDMKRQQMVTFEDAIGMMEALGPLAR